MQSFKKDNVGDIRGGEGLCGILLEGAEGRSVKAGGKSDGIVLGPGKMIGAVSIKQRKRKRSLKR